MNSPLTGNSPPEVGATLQRLRLARGLTLEDLSRIAGVSKSMLSQIEREKANPTIAITWRLANALGVQIGELLATAEKDPETIRVLDAHETEGAEAMLETLARWGPMAHAAFLEYRMNAATISATGLAVIRRMIEGEQVDQASSGLSAREWRELMAVLGRAARS